MPSSARDRCLQSVLVLCCLVVSALTGQTTAQSIPATSAPSSQNTLANPPNGQPVVSIKTTVHHVVVDVVATDKHGLAVRDLTAKDFEISERVGWVGKVDEKIASFRLVDKTAPVPQGAPRTVVQIPPDSYSNLAATREPDEPLTVILIDELNTDMSKGDVRQELMKMANSVAGFNVPTAVFLLSNQLQMLQNFSSDGKQLRTTIDTLMKVGPFGGKQAAFNLQPSPAMQQQFGVTDSTSGAIPQSGPSGTGINGSPQFQQIKDLGKLKTANDRDLRVTTTVDALRVLARHLAGYPGRKKLVWISSAFPFSILRSIGGDEPISYRDEIREATNALADAQVAVYPIQPGGVWLPDLYDAARNDRPRPQNPNIPQSAFGQEMTTQSAAHHSDRATVEEVAEQTGGIPCLDSNDLGFCLKKVFTDGYTYYELSYYPPSDTWKEGFHKVTVKSTRSGVHLYFRRGYYATPDASPAPANPVLVERELKQAACEDALTATSVPLTVVPLGADQSGVVRYSVSVGVHASVGFTEPETNVAMHQLEFAACTFNNDGKPLQFGKIPLEPNAGTASTEDVFRRIFAFNTDPYANMIRWLVRDKDTGALGSVDLPYQPPAATPKPDAESASAALANLQQQMAPVVLESEKPDISPATAAQTSQNAAPNADQLPKLDNDDEIAGYCEGIGRPGANADALAKVCEYALSMKNKLPDILCRRSTREYWRSPLGPSRKQAVTEVAYLGGIEYDSDLTAQSAPGYFAFHRVGNSSSGGEFSAVLQGIFLPISNAEFHFDGEQVLDSVPAYVFDYDIAQADNRLYALQANYVGGSTPLIQSSGGMVLFGKSNSRTLPRAALTYPGYRGKIWIAKSTSQILRLERETSDVDPHFPITYASTIIKYANAELGDGSRFVLSTDADIVTCTADEGKECSHNFVVYDACHKFRATSRIIPDPPPAGSNAPAGSNTPAGLNTKDAQ